MPQVPNPDPSISPSNVPGSAPTAMPDAGEHPASPEAVEAEVKQAQDMSRLAVSKPDAPDQVSPEKAREMQAEDEAKDGNAPPPDDDDKPKSKKKGS